MLIIITMNLLLVILLLALIHEVELSQLTKANGGRFEAAVASSLLSK